MGLCATERTNGDDLNIPGVRWNFYAYTATLSDFDRRSDQDKQKQLTDKRVNAALTMI